MVLAYTQSKTVDVTPIVPSMLGKVIRIVSDDGPHVSHSVRRRDSSNWVFPAFIFDWMPNVRFL